MRGRLTAVLACAALAACSEAESVEVQELPPLQRPSAEARAGLPEVRGIWRFAGFEIRPQDTTLVREMAYQLTPPGEVRVITQRLDSIAGQIVRDGVGFPFTGEVRRDSTMAVVAFAEGTAQFASGRIRGDTFWIELTTFGSAAGWPPQARAALVRRPVGAPFRRLLGGAPITVPVDSAALRDSVRMDSLRRAGVAVPPAGQPGTLPPGATVPGAVPPQPGAVQPGARPGVPVTQPQRPPVQAQPQQRPPVQAQPQQRPPAQAPPRTQPQRPPAAAQPPVTQPQPTQPAAPPPPVPNPNAPRDTLRFGAPPG